MKKFLTKTFILFCLVGLVNTATDVGLFVALTAAGVGLFVANIISTSAALCISFLLNNSIVFNGTGDDKKRRITLFIIITLIGIWVLQPIVIVTALYVLEHTVSLADHYDAGIAKLAAVPVSTVWNFLMYKKFVFKTR